MNRQIRALALAMIACYVALFVQLNFLSVVRASDLNARPDNGRAVQEAFNKPRGDIVSADGKLVATSIETDGTLRYQRTYPTGDLFGHISGSYSFLFGSDGVEKVYDDELRGDTSDFALRGLAAPLVEGPNVGTINLTLRSDVQQAARDALGPRRGSVVALDPRSGDILAMWSWPSYDPNLVAANDEVAARAFREAFNADRDKPTRSRAYRERYFPGSTFKVVTAAAGLESGTVTEAFPDYPRATSYTAPLTNRPLSNFGGSTCGGTLFEALEVSCNSVFAEMAAETIGPDPMIAEAEDFGFNQDVPIDLPGAVTSDFPTDFGKRLRPGNDEGDADVYEDTPGLAQAGIGQGNVSATPLQMAMVAAGVANGGSIMTPHVMASVRDRSGSTVTEYPDSVWREAMTSANAAVLRQAMVQVVTDGTASRLAIDGLVVGGKTGTAQLGSDPPRSHAWIISFAGPPNQPPDIAVAVIVEGQPGADEQTGGRVAAPIARAVIEAARSGG